MSYCLFHFMGNIVLRHFNRDSNEMSKPVSYISSNYLLQIFKFNFVLTVLSCTKLNKETSTCP